jgi:hypothetical protein
MSQTYVEAGKRWLKNIFEQISNELKDTVVLVHWDFQDNDPAYRLCFQIAGQEEETLSFTRGTLRSCGKSDEEAVRRRVEAAIRNRLLCLAKHEQRGNAWT